MREVSRMRLANGHENVVSFILLVVGDSLRSKRRGKLTEMTDCVVGRLGVETGDEAHVLFVIGVGAVSVSLLLVSLSRARRGATAFD